LKGHGADSERRGHSVLSVHEGGERSLDCGHTEVPENGGGGHQAVVPTMKTKDISFDPDALVASVEVIADPVRGERKATLRRRTLLPIPVKPMEVRDIAEIRRRLNVSKAVFASLINVSRVTAIRWEKRCRREVLQEV